MSEALAKYRSEPDAVLLDVRTPAEYAGGHIPDSVNIPVSEIRKVSGLYPKPDTSMYVYCLSGARSSFAKEELERLGYEDVTDLGGLNGYHGKVVKE